MTTNEIKSYDINVHYDVAVSVRVCATNEEDAIEMAKEKATAMSLNDAEYCEISSVCVCDVTECSMKDRFDICLNVIRLNVDKKDVEYVRRKRADKTLEFDDETYVNLIGAIASVLFGCAEDCNLPQFWFLSEVSSTTAVIDLI